MTAHKDDVYVISENDILTGDTVIPTIPVTDRPTKHTRAAGKHRTVKMRSQPRPARGNGARGETGRNTEVDALIEDPIDETRRAPTSAACVPIAAMMSFVVCGAGQIFNGHRKLGALLFLTEALAVVSHWAIFQAWTSFVSFAGLFGITEQQLIYTVAAADALMIVLVLFSVGHAYHMAERRALDFDGIRIPAVSGAASALVPGLGQILNAQPGKALVFFFCLLAGAYGAVAASMLPIKQNILDLSLRQLLAHTDVVALAVGGFAAGLIWVTSVYDAFLVARYKRELI